MTARAGSVMVGVSMVLVAAATVGVSGSASVAATSPSSCSGGPRWVTAWSSSPSDNLSSLDPGLRLNLYGPGQSFRMIAHPGVGGKAVRIRLSNRFGRSALTFDHVTVGRRTVGAQVDPASMRDITFDGNQSGTAQPGRDLARVMPRPPWRST